MINVYLKGRRANRTPLSYPDYQVLFRRHLTYAETPKKADLLIYSCFMDIRDDQEELAAIYSLRPDIKLVVLSEEPYWDSLWSENLFIKRGELQLEGWTCPYVFLNHFTTNIYDFEKIPYFITTNNDLFTRYAFIFARNATRTAPEVLLSWEKAPVRTAFYAEFRSEKQYDVYFPRQDVWGLSRYRTLIAQGVKGDGVVRVGHGWGPPCWREYLPDWHLDKLVSLDQRAFLVSAIENTHLWNYVAEKLFDAFAVLAIPFYFASPMHAATRLVPPGAFLNLYGLQAGQAIQKISEFRPDHHFADTYLDTQERLARMFSQPADLAEERQRVVAEVVAELRACC